MGVCYPQTAQIQVREHKWQSEGKVKLIGFVLNADTYTMQLMLKKAGISYDYEDVNMLKNEHESEQFEKAHPCKYLPILQDGDAYIYGSTYIMLMHICSRFKREGERLMPKEYRSELSREFSAFEETQKRPIKLLRRMLIAKILAQNAPSVADIARRRKEFDELVLPALNAKLRGKQFFVAEQQTVLDLVIFVEVETVLVLLHKDSGVEVKLEEFKDLFNWLSLIRGLPDYHDVHLEFSRRVQQLTP